MYNKRVNICHQTLEVVCEEYKISSTLIANKRDIDLFARGKKDIRFLQIDSIGIIFGGIYTPIPKLRSLFLPIWF